MRIQFRTKNLVTGCPPGPIKKCREVSRLENGTSNHKL